MSVPAADMCLHCMMMTVESDMIVVIDTVVVVFDCIVVAHILIELVVLY